jgi:folate-binding protein YgfZ
VDESASLASIGVYGIQARYVVEQVTGIGHSALALLPPYSHISLATPDGSLLIVRSPDLELEGYDVFVAASQFDAMWDAIVRARATPAGLSTWEVARVEAGRPEWGVDMDDATIPQEANLDGLGAISYTKGCYTGQEVVARVHFRGHVNKTLRGLRAASAPPPIGAALLDATGKAVGEVRTSLTSPRLGGIALGMVRREIEAGTSVTARWADDASGDIRAGETLVEVVTLPFLPANEK